MARQSERDRDIAYPRLTRDQIDLMITMLARGQRPGVQLDGQSDSAQLFAYLLSFYTRRWGLPPAIHRPGGPPLTPS